MADTATKYGTMDPPAQGGNGKDPFIKVTYLGKGWGVRCFAPDGRSFSELCAKKKEMIGPAARDLLRWHDKMGGVSRYASRARHRAWDKGRACTDENDTRLRNLDMNIRRFDSVKLEAH